MAEQAVKGRISQKGGGGEKEALKGRAKDMSRGKQEKSRGDMRRVARRL